MPNAEHELDRRRRDELLRSLMNPHPENAGLSELGLPEWARDLPQEDTGVLVNVSTGKPVRWTPGEGWQEIKGPKRK